MKSHEQIWSEWQALVNMSADDMNDWLETDESNSVGDTKGQGESTGHKAGRAIARILRMDRFELDDLDWKHMGKVVGYIKRHTAQGGPARNVATSKWRYSLMNWGHDPLKK